MDAVTAVSGSGPAYIFLLAEAMAAAALAEGLPAEAARTLVLETVLGAARMLTESGEDPAELRRRVTSPGGTTQAAVETFKAGGLRELVASAIHNATERGRQLSAANDSATPVRSIVILLLCIGIAACGNDAPKPAKRIDTPQEAAVRDGDVTARANVIATGLLQERMAREYGIPRDDHSVLLMISVRKDRTDSTLHCRPRSPPARPICRDSPSRSRCAKCGSAN